MPSAIRSDIDEAFAGLDAKGRSSLDGLRVPRSIRKGLEKLPELIPDEEVLAIAAGKDPTVHPSAGATMSDISENIKSMRVLVVTEMNFWQVQAGGRLNGTRPKGMRTALADIADVGMLSERKLNRFGTKERILNIDHLRGAQMETMSVEILGSDETLELFGSALTEQVREVNEVIAAAERPASTPPPSVADELSKLSELLRNGILSEAEFEAQKNKLLSS